MIAIFGSVVIAALIGFAGSFDWARFEAETELRSGWNERLWDRKNFCDMVEDFAEVLSDHPTLNRLCARAYVYRALFDRGNSAFASFDDLSDFDEAIRLDANYAQAYANRGSAWICVYRLRGYEVTSERIIYDLKTAIAIAPHSCRVAQAYSILATEYLCVLNQPEVALDVCDMAIANLPEREKIGFYHTRAWIYAQMGRSQPEAENRNAARLLEDRYMWNDRVDSLLIQGSVLFLMLFPVVLILRMGRPRLVNPT